MIKRIKWMCIKRFKSIKIYQTFILKMSSKLALFIIIAFLFLTTDCTLKNRHSLNHRQSAATTCPEPAFFNAISGKCECKSNQIYNQTSKSCQCPNDLPYFNGTNCINCRSNQFFNTTTKNCSTCPEGTIFRS